MTVPLMDTDSTPEGDAELGQREGGMIGRPINSCARAVTWMTGLLESHVTSIWKSGLSVSLRWPANVALNVRVCVPSLTNRGGRRRERRRRVAGDWPLTYSWRTRCRGSPACRR